MQEAEFLKIQYEDEPFQKWRIVLNFERKELSLQRFEQNKVSFDCAHNLQQKDLNKIKPLLKVADFEKFRDSSEFESDRDATGNQMDETWICFAGVSDSKYPFLKIDMRYEHHPNRAYEILYNYLVTNYFSKKKLGYNGLLKI